MRRVLSQLLLAALIPASAAAAVRLEVGRVEAEPGERVSVPVRLVVDGGEDVATIGNDITFDATVLRVARAEGGSPDCAIEPGLQLFLSSFFDQPPDCDLEARECFGLRALAVLLQLGPPPHDLVVYRCNVEVAADAPPGIYLLANGSASYADSNAIEGPVLAVAGSVAVSPDLITPTPQTPVPTPRVLGPSCTGDCDASGDVTASEESALVRAVFDADELRGCVGTREGSEEPAKAAHLLAAVRAREEGCRVATPTRTRRVSRTPTATTTATASATIPPSRTPTVFEEIDTPTPTVRTSRTATATRTRSSTRTPRPTETSTRPRPRTPSATPTPTRVVPSATATPDTGPLVTFVGLARGDGQLIPPSGDIDGVPLFDVVNGSGFHLVVEGRPGPTRAAVGRVTFNPDEPPDLQILADRDLGDGSRRVCVGGVPGFDPPEFVDDMQVINALNDLACRFDDATCVLFLDGTRNFVEPSSTIQFCGLISSNLRFKSGETRLQVRLLDTNTIPSEPAQIVVRVGGTLLR